MHKLKPRTEEQHCLQPHLQNVTEFQAWNSVLDKEVVTILQVSFRLLPLSPSQFATSQFAVSSIWHEAICTKPNLQYFFSFWSLLSSNQLCVYIYIYSISLFITYSVPTESLVIIQQIHTIECKMHLHKLWDPALWMQNSDCKCYFLGVGIWFLMISRLVYSSKIAIQVNSGCNFLQQLHEIF
jgi:hypothetical protein